jgi:class 3 adenylate cyclase
MRYAGRQCGRIVPPHTLTKRTDEPDRWAMARQLTMLKLRRATRQLWLLALAATLIASASAELLWRSGWTSGAESVYTDFWHRLAGVRHEPRHTALVMVDDPSLTARPDEPLAFWTPHFARALATLRQVGVRLVAIDFVFNGSPERWIERLGLMGDTAARSFDQPFRAQISLGDLVLAGVKVGNGDSIDDFVLPHPDYLLALPDLDMPGHVGLANLHSDTDGAVRQFSIAEAAGDFVEREGMPRFSFAGLAVLRTRGDALDATSFDFGGRPRQGLAQQPIAFTGPPGTFRPLSFETLLRPDAAGLPEVTALAGKVVVIGAGYAGVNDVHPTPYSAAWLSPGKLMSGPEIQANIVETLLAGRIAEALPTPWRLAGFVTVFGMLAFLGVRLLPLHAVALVAAAALGAAAVAYLAFSRDLYIPLAHLQFGMVIVLGCLLLLRLSREERERARIGATLGRYVSSQVVTSLLESPHLPELGGQSRQITVLFADIRNFTSLSEQLPAREVVEILSNYFERACAVLLNEGATIDKFIGDAVMAEFGAPQDQPDHAARALRAAVALSGVAVEFRHWMEERFSGRDVAEFSIGIGLHSGDAIVGNIGASMRMEYTAIGDTVNLASRIEGMTKEIGCVILASSDTIRLAGGKAVTGGRHHFSVKGRAQPVEAFEVLGVLP